MKQMNAREQGYTIIVILTILVFASISVFASVEKQAVIQYQQKGSAVYGGELTTNVIFKSGYELNHQYNTKKFKVNRLYCIIHWFNTPNNTITLIDGHNLPYPFTLYSTHLQYYSYFLATDTKGNKWLINTK